MTLVGDSQPNAWRMIADGAAGTMPPGAERFL
jgi:uncharacterized membrane protein